MFEADAAGMARECQGPARYRLPRTPRLETDDNDGCDEYWHQTPLHLASLVVFLLATVAAMAIVPGVVFDIAFDAGPDVAVAAFIISVAMFGLWWRLTVAADR